MLAPRRGPSLRTEASFDVTAALAGQREAQISLFCTREFLNELGTGGLLSPVVLYREKD